MIPPEYLWTCLLPLALGTFAIRYSIIAISTKVVISDRVREVLSFIPASVLPAFVAPAVFFHQGSVQWAFGKERFLILLCATAICLATRNTFFTIASGLGLLYLLTQF